MDLKAIVINQGGPSKEFVMSTTNVRNSSILQRVALRAQSLDNGRKILRAKHLMADDIISDRLLISNSPHGITPLGFDFQKVYFDCTGNQSPGVVFCDERRDRSMRIQLGQFEMLTLTALNSETDPTAVHALGLTDA